MYFIKIDEIFNIRYFLAFCNIVLGCICYCFFFVNLIVKICFYRKGNLNYFLLLFLYVII